MDKEEKREWLPASEWKGAAEEKAWAQPWLDPMGRDQRPPEERGEPIDPDNPRTYPKELTDSLEDTLSVYDGLERFQLWLKRATASLYYPPDRKRVKQEFTEHFEERVEGLTERGMSLGDAQKKAVELLGSPEETGELLRLVHKPWLGWVLRLLRVSLAALVILVSVNLIQGTENLRFLTRHQVLQAFELADKTREDGTKIQITTIAERPWTAGGDIQFGAFTVSCEDVIYRYQRREWLYEDSQIDPEYEEEIDVLLRFTGAPWDKLPRDFEEYVRIVDDNGTVYDTSDYDYIVNHTRPIHVYDERVLPWASVECIRIDRSVGFPDDAKRLDIFLGKGDSAQKISVWLGDWELRDLDALPREDEADTSRWEMYMNSSLIEGMERGAFVPTAEQKNGVELSVLSSALEAYPEDPAGPVEPDPKDPSTIYHGEVAECVLTVRGDMALQPLSYVMMEQRLRIVDPAQGPDATAIPCAVWKIDVCRDFSVWVVYWRTTPGTKEYELQYWPTQEKPAGTLTLKVEEERNP